MACDLDALTASLVTHFACCHQYKGYWCSCPLGWSYFTVMPGLNLRAGGAHASEFTVATFCKDSACRISEWNVYKYNNILVNEIKNVNFAIFTCNALAFIVE